MKIAVTGGAGFIASQIAEAYLAAGHQVIVLDNLCTGKRTNVPTGAKLYEVDIRSPEVGEIFRSERPEAVSHHAAQLDVRKSVADPGFDAEVNVLGMLNVLEAGRRVGVSRVIFASSGGAVYGEPQILPAPESHPHQPLSPYGITKSTGEHYLAFYRAVHGIAYVALRYSNVYGPRQDPHGEAGVVAIFSERLLAGEVPTIYGDGKQTRDYVYVGDVVRANVAALSTDFVGPVNIGTSIETDVNQLCETMRVLTRCPHQAKHAPSRAGEQMRSVIAIDRARDVLRWRPEVTLEEGLRRTIEFFRANAR